MFHLFALLLLLFIYLIRKHIWIPYRIQTHFARQGVRGPPRNPLSGNARHVRDLIAQAQSEPTRPFAHDIVGRVQPHYRLWAEKYGRTFLFWFGPTPRLAVSDPDAIKLVLTDPGCFVKVGFNPLSRQLFGEGLVALKGDKWAQRRKILSPAFNMERVKVSSTIYFCQFS